MANTSLAQLTLANSGRQSMNADAAKYFNALVAKIKADTGITIVATEGTRTYARQKELYDGYRAGRIDPTTGKRYNPAWSPDDPRANHLSGRAVDVGSGVGYVSTPAARAWRALATAYGFRETVAGEPWHFEWRSDWVAVTLPTTPAANSEEDEDEMSAPALIQHETTKALSAIGVEGSGVVKIRNEAHYNEIANFYNSTGGRLRSKAKGLTSWPAWKSLSGYYTTLSPTGYDEAVMFFTPKK